MMSSFRSAVLFTNLCFALIFFLYFSEKISLFQQAYILNKPEACNFILKRDSDVGVFLWILRNFLEHLRTAASETGTENSLGNSAWGEKYSARNEELHIVSFFFNSFNQVKNFSPGWKYPYNQHFRYLTGYWICLCAEV